MSFRLRSSILVLSLASFVPVLAHADSYYFSATLNSPPTNGSIVPGSATGYASGVVDYDPTTQKFTGGNFNVTYFDGTVTNTYNFASLYYSASAYTTQYSAYTVDADGTDSVLFQIAVPDGFTSGDVCSYADSTGCIQTGNSPHYVNTSLNTIDDSTGSVTGTLEVASSGTLTPTPEPSSIAMLGTGFVGIAGIMRRRFRK